MTHESGRRDDALSPYEALLQQLADELHEVFWVLERAGEQVRYISQGYEEIWGRTRRSLYAEAATWMGAVHPEDRAAALAQLDECRRGASTSLELRIVRPDGEVRWLRNRAFPLRGEDGRAVSVAGFVEDITTRKRAEETLRRSEVRWRHIVDALPVWVWTATAGGGADYFSPQSSAHTGLTQAELIGSGWLDAVHPDDRERSRRAWAASLENQGDYSSEHRFRGANGTYRWFLCRAIPIADGAGAIGQWIGVAIDVTGRKELEARLELALQSSHVSILDCDRRAPEPDGHPDPRGGLAKAWTGLTIGDLDSFLDLAGVIADDRPRTTSAIQDCIDGTAEAFSCEFRYLDAQGSVRWRLARGTAKRDPDGTATGLVAGAIDITDRKQLEEEARTTKARLDIAVSTSHMSLWEYELTDGLVIHGRLRTDEAIVPPEYRRPGTSDFQSNLEDLGILHEDFEKWTRAIQACVDGLTPTFHCEVRFRDRDGSLRWRLARGTVARAEDGTATGFVGGAIDITELKQTSEELRRAKERLELGARVSGLSSWDYVLTDGSVVNSRMLYENTYAPPGYMEITGDDFVTTMNQFGILPEDQAPFTAAIQDCVDGKTDEYGAEVRVRLPDGTIRWRLVRGSARRDSGGQPTGFVGGAVDITQRKEAELESKRLKTFLEHAVRSSNIQIWAFEMPGGGETDFRQTLFNVGGFDGYESPELPRGFAPSLALMVHPGDQSYVADAIQACLRGKESVFEVSYRTLEKDAVVRWHLGRGTVQRDALGRPTGLVGTSVDITAMKRVEGDLESARFAAEAANRAKDEFLANVSHEIRTPMNAIIGMTELALEWPLADGQRRLLKTVMSAADSLLGIINDLLDFSKLEAGRLELDVSDFSLRALLGETLRAFAARAHRKGVELVGHVDPDGPDAVIGDPGRLRQILWNIIDNAIKFTEQGEVVVEASVSRPDVTAPGDERLPLLVTVRDTGIGIAPDRQHRIFQAFEQGDMSTTRRYGGTGLGLSIATQLVNMMDGTLAVESAPHRGSTFSFTVRIRRQAHEATAVPALPPALLKDLRVLVVDDNVASRLVLERWLRGWQMAPTAVGDAVSSMGALWDAASDGASYSLVLLDSKMPDTDGWTLASRIRERASLARTPIIMLTSGEPDDSARDGDREVDAHLLKPIQQDELLETMVRVLSKPTVDSPIAAASHVQRTPSTSVRGGTAPRILVAEDDEFSAQLINEVLTRSGHRMQLATNGRQALSLACEGDFDLLLLDIHMPELDGFEVVAAIRARELATGRHLPIIALTARSGALDRDRCLAAGMDAFLRKPLRPKDVLAAIDGLALTRVDAPVGALATRAPLRLLNPVSVLKACGEDDVILRAICDALRTHLPRRMAEVRRTLGLVDALQLREAAHKLRALLYAFSTAAGDVASSLEDCAARECLQEALPLVEQLEAMVGQLLPLTENLTVARLLDHADVARNG